MEFPFTGRTPQIGAKAPQMGAKAPQIGQGQTGHHGTLMSSYSEQKVIWAFNLQRRVVSIRETVNSFPTVKLTWAPVGKIRIGCCKCKGAPGHVYYQCFVMCSLSARLFNCEPFRGHCSCDLCYAKSLQSCRTLSDPMDCSLTGSSIHGIFQATVLEWGAIAFSCDLTCLMWTWKIFP